MDNIQIRYTSHNKSLQQVGRMTPEAKQDASQHARDVYDTPELPDLIKVHKVVEAPEYDPDFELADSMVTVLYKHDPVLCTEFVESGMEKVEFSSKQDSPEKWDLHIKRRGTKISIVYKDETQKCTFHWNADDDLRNWGEPKEQDGSVLTEARLRQSRRVGQELLLDKVWAPTGEGRETIVGLFGMGTKWLRRT